MIGLGEPFPFFQKLAVASGPVDSIEKGKEFFHMGYTDNLNDGRWMVMFWYPKDFTFICPTELAELNRSYDEFSKRNTDLIAASTDSEYVHLAWRKSHPDLRELKFPMLADTSKSLAEALGILTNDDEKIANRVTIIADPKRIIRWVCANDMKVPRNVKEILRVLDLLINTEE